ncbi:uncharacterized protein At2g39795, mitochondrial-like [Rhododendron vialii]|uniref:uncharacterized protein At2g39795, mitochondrial-like n=1 Tax=Rhododendron vialii TaxID=182163 RepID=UPI00265EF598|nr:uncharacterized protein At2g39795, mitochondrial-like [Rhododendron vialii]
MALSSIVRMPVSAILPPAIQRTGSQRYPHSSALFCTVKHSNLSLHGSRKSKAGLSVRSSKSKKQPSPDESLLRVLESEISKAAVEESDGYTVVNSSSDEQVPKNLPFKIQDNPGQQMILLTREYKGETINVEVYTPAEDEDEDEDEDEYEDEDENEEEEVEEAKSHKGEDEDDSVDDYESRIPLAVKVSKKSGPSLEFGCTADPDGFEIDYLSIKDPENAQEDDIAYQGPKFSDLAEDLQDALYKYLEIRGFNDNTARFLHDYMTSKDRKEYTIWLKRLKKFVEE